MSDRRRRLAALLVAAYSGEQAAALAYRGHWRSCVAPDERDRIRRIEEEECPMYGASLLERSNVCSYDEAAALALEGGLPELVGALSEMAEVEREHERYFQARVACRSRWLGAGR